MLRYKNRERALVRRGFLAQENPDPNADPSGDPGPSNPSGADPAPNPAKARIDRRRSRTSEQLLEGFAEVREGFRALEARLSALEGPAKPKPTGEPEKKEAEGQLKSDMDAMKKRLIDLEKNHQAVVADNARLLHESIQTRFYQSLDDPSVEAPIKPGLRQDLFNRLADRLALNPKNPSELVVLYRDPQTGAIKDGVFEKVHDEDLGDMRPKRLSEFLKEELQKPQYEDFIGTATGPKDPGLKDIQGAWRPPSKSTQEDAMLQERTKAGDENAIARRLTKAMEADQKAAAGKR